ncbi:hypothetical protein [Bartonella taylorii]|uniref:Uncharacterized protein n=1 Tax=Bartonella taylorii TaxID=33046 RepID=A0A9Q9DNM6_BARTA|nr:hypothetical protein [Bartonella taylorii]USP03623.1 hypothetical protein LAJ60_04200 [Bartonella taylorii]
MNISLNEVADVVELANGDVAPILAATKYAQREIIQVCENDHDMDNSHEVQ